MNADSDDDPFAAHTDDDQDSDEELDSSEDQDGDAASAYKADLRGAEAGTSGSSRSQQAPHRKSPKAASRSQRQTAESTPSELSSENTDDSGNSDRLGSGSSGVASGSANLTERMSDFVDEDESDDYVTEGSEGDDGNGQNLDDRVHNIQRSKKGSSGTSSESKPASDDREELRRLMASDQKTIASTISQAAKADAVKGKAVKQQRTTFDSLLNSRIKLQKGLSAMNEIRAVVEGDGKNAVSSEDVGGEGESADAEAIRSAESAALTLWSTLEELRTVLADTHAKDGSKKRKRPSPISPTADTASLWERVADLETESLAHRRSILDKWSSKVRGTPSTLPNARGKLLGSASNQQSITAVLDAHVATELGDRSSKRARQNTSSKDNNSAGPEPIYDDTIFYQSLLRDLVEQRMSSDAMTGGLDTLHQLPSRLPIHPITGMRNDKTKRDVDTRASKGRKMRFNVHEKLQNFMAPEDRGSWTGRARDEFFASLLGKTASGLLGEGDDSASDEESDNDREEGGLRLFRN